MPHAPARQLSSVAAPQRRSSGRGPPSTPSRGPTPTATPAGHPPPSAPAGTGAPAKLVSNHIAGLHNLVAAEALAVGRAAGLSLDTMLAALRPTDAQRYALS